MTTNQTTAQNEVRIEDLQIGTGVTISKGALVFCHYTGTLDDGTKFDSSRTHGRPFEFVVGSKKVIQGLSLGVMGMREGGKRILHIPAALAYGERIIGALIPPHSNLNFEVEVLEVRPREYRQWPAVTRPPPWHLFPRVSRRS